MRQGRKPPLPSITKARAKGLRKWSTDAESRLWFRLRAARLDGLKFRRQHPIPPYIVDFYCEAARLVVELDGSQHGKAADAVRDRALTRNGMKILRFLDNDVLRDTETVLAVILDATRGRTLTPAPLPEGEGNKS